MKALLLSIARTLTVGSALALAAACAAQPASLPAPSAQGDDDDSAAAPAGVTAAPSATTPPTGDVASTTTLSLTAISPPSVTVGASPTGVPLTLTGTNFAAGSQVSIAGVLVPATLLSATSMTVTLPAANMAQPGSIAISVVSAAQLRSNEVQLPVTAGGVGVSGLFSVTPSFAPQATTTNGSLLLTVSGSGFDQNSVIVFNGQNIPTLMFDTNTLRGNLPNQFLLQPGQAQVSVLRQGMLTPPLPFMIGNGGGVIQQPPMCQTTCQQMGMFPGQCTTVGGIDIGFGPFDFGGIGGTDVMCGFDGCVVEGCN